MEGFLKLLIDVTRIGLNTQVLLVNESFVATFTSVSACSLFTISLYVLYCL